MRLWLRRVWPSWFSLFSMLVAYAAFLGFEAYVEWVMGIPFQALQTPFHISLTVLWLAAGAYGAYRVFAFHPYDKSYGSWLATTPWSNRKPLPLGPVHLAIQDVLMVGLVLVLAWFPHGFDTLTLLQLFLTTYFGS